MKHLGAYWFLLRNFRNGFSLIQNCRHGGYLPNGPVVDKAVLWDGACLKHPSNRGGMVGILLEIWYENIYNIGDFYTPKDTDVIVDVGAHVGLFSLWVLKNNNRCRVVSVEPSPENFACLQENARTRKWGSVEIHQRALGGSPGKVKMMTIDSNRSYDARTTAAEASENGAVDVITLPELFELAKTDRIALLKIDAEGAEYDAFSSLDDAPLRQFLSRVDKIVMEYHDHWKPGTLALLKDKLSATHELTILPDPGEKHGRLFGKLRTR